MYVKLVNLHTFSGNFLQSSIAISQSK